MRLLDLIVPAFGRNAVGRTEKRGGLTLAMAERVLLEDYMPAILATFDPNDPVVREAAQRHEEQRQGVYRFPKPEPPVLPDLRPNPLFARLGSA